MLRDVGAGKIKTMLRDAYELNGYGDKATQGRATATVAGHDFMRATWSHWFGKTDQPELGAALMSKL
ncbi:MAG: hypothetical protein HYV09_18910 [Deltaproteobacteria bacterium]|nr:hypothetical protein [Deltaproteobacteria bacterium]